MEQTLKSLRTSTNSNYLKVLKQCLKIRTMAHILPFPFQPQPPSHPKMTGGKRGPSAPISIPSLINDDEDSDQSITDHSPPTHNRISTFELPANVNKQSNLVFLTSTKNHINFKKFNSSSPRLLSSINAGSSNLNQNHNGSVLSNTVLTTVPVTYLIFNNNNVNSSLLNSLSTSNSHGESIPKNAQFTTTVLNSTPASAINTQQTLTSTIDSLEPESNSINNSNDSHSLQPISISGLNTKDDSSNTNDGSCSPSATFAYEHDHDYDNIASPSSSTSSGPIYVRPPGFKHHAQEIVAPTLRNNLKKKKNYTTISSLKEGFKKREATPPKLKPKREPLPMKLRALPQSFWQQPNVVHQVSPSTLFPVLPPLPCRENEDSLMDIRPVTPPDERETARKSQQNAERRLIVTNTDLLSKLFDCVGEEKSKTHASNKRSQQKVRKPVPKCDTKGLFLGNDPYMVEAVTEKILPQLSLEGSKISGGGNTSLQLITFKEGDKTVTLPSLSMDQNYPQLLSELVMHI